MTSEVASAVAQQTTVTGEIARHVAEAAAGSGEVARVSTRLIGAINNWREDLGQL